jgi:phosphohistidine phosphatase SixA
LIEIRLLSGCFKIKTMLFNFNIIFWWVFSIVFCSTPNVLAGEQEIWRALSSKGNIALIRHTIAPGIGDPPEFSINDCETQRNLSEEGRLQAKRLGDRFRENGIGTAQIFSSQWCRCLETASLLKLGKVEKLPILNSFYRQYEREDEQTKELKSWILRQNFEQPIILITHQVNITALTGIFPASGELVAIKAIENGKIQVRGTIENY